MSGTLYFMKLPPVAAWQAREGQRAEAHGTLGPRRIELLAKRFQVAQGGGAHEPLPRAPQQGGAAQVHQGTVSQRTALTLRLKKIDTDKK